LQISVLWIPFFNFMALLLFQFTAKRSFGVYFWANLHILGLFFWICLAAFVSNLSDGFMFF